MNVHSIGAQTISNAFARAERGAAEVQRGARGARGATEASTERGLVDLIEAKAQVKAGVATVRIADEMFAALIDIGQDA